MTGANGQASTNPRTGLAPGLPIHEGGRFNVAWTGHRPELFADPAAVASAIKTRARELREAHKDLLAFHCGGQRGVDTWAATAAEELGISLHVYIPGSLEEFTADWTPADVATLEATLQSAEGRALVDGKDPYLRRNAMLVEHGDLLIAVWTGLGGGGTAQTIDLARAQGRPVEEHRFPPSGLIPQPGERGV